MRSLSLPKIISKYWELVKLCHINRSIPVFFRATLYSNKCSDVLFTGIALSRWRPRPLNTISGFALVDVAAFRRSKSMSKLNFVDISQLMAKITTSVFAKQTSAILQIYFRFRFRPFARNLHIILHQAIPNFVQIEAFTAEIWRHIHFLRWRPRRLNTTSGFVSVDVTAFRRSKSISKPNFVEISQMEAEIYFLWQSKMAWEGVKFFSKSRMCQYPMMLCYILWIQKCIFDACRLSLHNSTPSHCTNMSTGI